MVVGVRFLWVVVHLVEVRLEEVCLEERLCPWVVEVRYLWVVGHLEEVRCPLVVAHLGEVRLEEMLCPWVVGAHLEVVGYP